MDRSTGRRRTPSILVALMVMCAGFDCVTSFPVHYRRFYPRSVLRVATAITSDFFPDETSCNETGDGHHYVISSVNLKTNHEQKQKIEQRDPNFRTKNDGKASSVASITFSLMKAMLGSGVLALPSGVAAISDYPSMIVPANLLFLFLGGLSAYTFALYGRLCHATQARSLGDIWKRVYNSDSSTPLSLVSFCFCYGSCLIFLLIIGDTIKSLATAVMASTISPTAMSTGTASLVRWITSRQSAILFVSTTMLWPLCKLKSVVALAPLSILGVVASIVSSAFVALRCPALCPSSPYNPLFSGQNFLASLPPHGRPVFNTFCNLKSSAPMLLMGMGGAALMAHFSAPDFYNSLAGNNFDEFQSARDHTTNKVIMRTADDNKNQNNNINNNNSDIALKKYLLVTVFGFIAVAIINALTMTCGFLTFGASSAGMILNNYASTDIGAAISRSLVAVSMIGGYPLMFMALKSAALDMIGRQRNKHDKNEIFRVDFNESKNNNIKPPSRNMILFSSLVAISMFVKDAGFVVSLNGAIMGSVLIYSFPALLFLRLAKTGRVVGGQVERMLCRGLVAFGIIGALMGGATAVMNSYFPHLLR